ncbi:hypothetical protein B0T26DRAFT_446666 [Lasiosphaeria miniovina]|uniref:Uncharacterized protein n=1 Tax=Lasiosphaeria miniovina TaxID=1954250 RepID=A0AA40DNF7_9PEZI|nr:uncharacterized protein B0T26DRAFT_446666 [Lasiosphaeria miniovina]KAK0706278.1 hypothetical protein B0T26DRAFT_446666 [Lasiosphaeria miniovina]
MMIADPTNSTTFDLFRQSALSNKWRSVTFQSLGIAALGDGGGAGGDGMPGTGVVAQLGEANVERCVQQVMGFLTELSTISAEPLYADLGDEVRSLVRLAFEVALQFGVNQANLALLAVEPGEAVVIGPDFHDCEDADEHRGTRARVDLVVSPGLQRVGDGRTELARKRTIVPCEIFAGEEL